MSDADIDKGALWRSEIQANLEQAQAGIIVLSSENLERPWLVFEAGALSNKHDRVYTYLVGLSALPPNHPLHAFQNTATTEQDTLKMLNGVNRQIGTPIDESKLSKAFKHNWPEFEIALKEAVKLSPILMTAPPDLAAMLSEALGYLREQSKELALIREQLDPTPTGLAGQLLKHRAEEYFRTAFDYKGLSEPPEASLLKNLGTPRRRKPE